ncbi:MAG: glycosyltransferase [Fimbriimonadaceae bacterium]|nr:glycosyltransferase [Fimbriimonadaceae bacterium]
MRPLRIALFSESAPPVVNGVSVSVATLRHGLVQLGHEVHLYANRYPGHRENDSRTHRFLALTFPFWRNYPLTMPPAYPWLGEFRRTRFDVIHTHTPFPVGMIGLRWGESERIPVVSTYHTLYDRYAHYVPLVPRRSVRARLARHTHYYYNRCNRVITPSETARRWLERHAVQTPITVIPTGAAPIVLPDRSDARARFGLPDAVPVVLWVGRLAREKNWPLWVETIRRFAEQSRPGETPFSVLVVGDGPDRRAMQRALQQALGDACRSQWPGMVPPAEVGSAYAAADAFLFTSLTETQGLVVQEARRHGLPVVAAASGGVEEVLRGDPGAWLVRPDATALAAALAEALGAARATRREGIELAPGPAMLTDLEMATRVVEVYRQVLELTRAAVGSDGHAPDFGSPK